MTRSDIVTAARTWLGTPFHHQARLRGVGADCVGLVIGVARELALVAPGFDVTGYPRQPDGHSLTALASEHMDAIERDQMEPGDVVAVAFARDPQHVGVLGDYRHGGLSIIHSASIAGRVIETRLLFGPAMRFVAAYRLRGVV